MLPKELGNLYAAVTGSKEATFDAARLQSELTGIGTFHQSLMDNNLFTTQLAQLFETHVGKWSGSQQLSLTAPEGGVPVIQIKAMRTTVGATWVASVEQTVVCPHCHNAFKLP